MEYEEELLKKIEALYKKSLEVKNVTDEETKKNLLSDIKYIALLISRGIH